MSNNQEFLFLDIGSSKIAAVVGRIDKVHNIEIKDKLLTQSEGVKSSLITNLTKAEEGIVDVILSMEKSSKTLFKEACISVCASNAKSHYIAVKLRISGSGVVANDIQRLVHKALSSFDDAVEQVIHYFAIDFTLDGVTGITNPVGLLGKELCCNFHIVTVDSALLTNLINCLTRCQIKVKDIVLSTYAAALFSANAGSMQTGSLVVDFGSKSTSFAVLLDEKLLYFDSVPLGSWYITSDIAKAFSISMSSAEKLKTLYGSSKLLDNNTSMINLHEIDSSEFVENQVISAKDLSAVITPRVEEIFTLLKEKYTNLKIDDLIASNMILTGGGSALNNIAQSVGDIFAKTVKVYSDNDSDNTAGYQTALGMLKYIVVKEKRKFDLDNNIYNKGKLNKIWSWFKENI